MATTAKTEEKKIERVALHVPLGEPGTDPNLDICINGTHYVLPRGKVSEVPDFVAEEYNRSMRALSYAEQNQMDQQLQ